MAKNTKDAMQQLKAWSTTRSKNAKLTVSRSSANPKTDGSSANPKTNGSSANPKTNGSSAKITAVGVYRDPKLKNVNWDAIDKARANAIAIEKAKKKRKI